MGQGVISARIIYLFQKMQLEVPCCQHLCPCRGAVVTPWMIVNVLFSVALAPGIQSFSVLDKAGDFISDPVEAVRLLWSW